MTIDQCYQENSTIYIYEVLNSKGIQEIKMPFNYQKEDKKETEIEKEKNMENNDNNTPNNNNENNNIPSNNNENNNTPSNNNENNKTENDNNSISTQSTNNEINENNNKIILSNYTLKIEPKNFPQIYNTEALKTLKIENEILTLDNTLIFYPNRTYKTIESISNTIKNFEYPIQITYNYPILTNDNYLFNKFFINQISFPNDIIIFNTTEKNFTSRMLYDFIYEKNKKFLASINKSDNEIWWRTKNEKVKCCYPFIIRVTKQIENSRLRKCAFCPWYKFCPGCLLNPNIENSLKFNLNYIIHVEFCKSLYDNELIKNNINNITEIKLEDYLDENDQVEKNLQIESNLEDCFKLFLVNEKLEDPLTCAYCQSRQLFLKQNNFDKFPPVLIISLKRFKFASHYHNKITTFIKYPTENLELKGEHFDLYSVIYHFGSLNSGHYTCSCKINNEWYYFNDSSYSKKKPEAIINRAAYILFYINKKESNDMMYFSILKNLLNKLNDEEDNKFLKKKIKETKIISPDKFFKGEPINTIYGKGYFVKDKDDNNELKEVKYTFGFGIVNQKNIQHETNLILGYDPALDKNK